MNIKKKLGMGIATGALAVSLIGGGTYAYFSDTEVNNSSFAAGTLDINIEGNDKDNAIIDVGNLKPGDTMERTFKINNTGSLDVSQVLLTSKYEVEDLGNNNGVDNFAKHIKVQFLTNTDKGQAIIWDTTLDQIVEKDLVKRQPTNGLPGETVSGLPAGESDLITVKFHFVDNGKDQNIFQGDSIKLDWTFTAMQTAGEAR